MDKNEEVKEEIPEAVPGTDEAPVMEESNTCAPVEKQAVVTKGEETKKPEVYINLTGEPEKETYEKALIQEDAYNGIIVSVGLQEMKAYESNQLEKKFLISILIDEEKDKDGNEIILPLFVKPTITKAYGKGKSNSKLYSILEKANLLEEIGRMSGELELLDALRAFLESRLQSRSVRVEVKTTNKNNPDKVDYSSVKGILRFVEHEICLETGFKMIGLN